MLLVAMLTILTVNVFLRSKKEKNADAETKQDYFTPKRFLLYARCVSVVLVTLFLIGITGGLYAADDPYEDFSWIVFGVVVTFYITLPVACLYVYSFVCSVIRKTPLRQGVAVFSYPRYPTCRRHMLYSVKRHTCLITNTSSKNDCAMQNMLKWFIATDETRKAAPMNFRVQPFLFYY